MREEGGRIVLTDFGAMDQRFDHDGAASSPNGSLRSMAPELIRGGAASPSSDVYALGVLLYRLLSRRYPLPADRSAGSDPAALPLCEAAPGVPSALAAVVDRALAADPEARFVGPNAMAAALEAALEPSAPPKAPRAERYPPRERRDSMLAAIATSAVLSALVVAAVVGFGIPWLAKRYQAPAAPTAEETPTPAPAARMEPAVTLPAKPAPAPPVGLRAAPILYRVDPLGRERLADRARIHSGDQLVLEVETGSQPVTCFVLDEDGAGNAYVLFPLPGYRLGNPLAPRALHRLPDGSGAGAVPARAWSVDSENGSEDVILITSVESLSWLERLLRDLPRPSETPSEPPVATSLGQVTRGIGRVAPAPATGRLGSILDRLRESAAYRSGRAGFWRISLRAEPQVAW
jgi:hypothetical protein